MFRFTCIGLLFILFSCNGPTSRSPKNTVVSFIAAAKEGNIAEIKKYITRSDVGLLDFGENFLARLDTNGAKSMKEKMLTEFKEKTANAIVEIKEEKIDGDNATVMVAFNHNSKSETRPFNLLKEDGQWKISLLSTGMNNSGLNKQEIQNVMQGINLDSLKGTVSEGMKEFDKINKDSLNKLINDGMKDVEKNTGVSKEH